ICSRLFRAWDMVSQTSMGVFEVVENEERLPAHGNGGTMEGNDRRWYVDKIELMVHQFGQCLDPLPLGELPVVGSVVDLPCRDVGSVDYGSNQSRRVGRCAPTDNVEAPVV